jgi:hypothetical protein
LFICLFVRVLNLILFLFCFGEKAGMVVVTEE